MVLDGPCHPSVGAVGCNGSLWDRREDWRQRERREMEAVGTK